MRVLHCIPSISLVHGGPSRAISAIESSLKRQGICVTTLTTDDDGPGRRIRSVDDVRSPGGANRVYVRKLTEFYKVAPGAILWLALNLRKFDIVHVHGLFSFVSVISAVMARVMGRPYVIRPLGSLNRYGVKARRPLLKRLSIFLIEGPILRSTAAIHLTSLEEQAEALALGIPMRGHVIPLGIELPDGEAYNKRGISERVEAYQKEILFLSRIDPKKNIESLLDAIPLLDDLRSRCLIAGDGSRMYVDELKKRAEHLSISDRVVWLGDVEGADKQALFSAADVFILPSFSENFGIAAAEAAVAGCPVILSHGVAIARELAETGGGIAVMPTPSALADALNTVLGDDGLRLRMSESAAAFARDQYSSDLMARRLLALYRSLIGGSSNTGATAT